MAVRYHVSLRNGGALPVADVPRLRLQSFRDVIAPSGSTGRLVALFGMPAESGTLRLFAVLAQESEQILSVTSTEVGDSYPSLTPDCPQAHLFEREIAEQWGTRPEGHPWLKPIRFHRSYRTHHDAWDRGSAEELTPGVMPFFRVEGEEVHEVAVGPVHAGIIEPGHFRFQCHGERILHLEISLGYQHRGIEASFVGGPDKRTIHRVEAIAGDTAVGHGLAHSQVIEALSGAEVPARAQAIRAVALELERMANHAGDLGAIAGDVGYLPTASYCARVRGDLLNSTLAASGSRMGFGWIRPGGAAVDLAPETERLITDALVRSIGDLERSFDLIRQNSMVRARLEETGILSPETCETLGLVGLVRRASGFARDVRADFPAGAYATSRIPVATWPSGDVFARAHVRWLECAHSAAFVRELLDAMPRGEVRSEIGPLAPEHLAISLVEGWRGEIAHVAVTDGAGRFRRYKVIDPSFHNWWGLAMAMRNQPISDFPLCNKSFNLSYSGHDL